MCVFFFSSLVDAVVVWCCYWIAMIVIENCTIFFVVIHKLKWECVRANVVSIYNWEANICSALCVCVVSSKGCIWNLSQTIAYHSIHWMNTLSSFFLFTSQSLRLLSGYSMKTGNRASTWDFRFCIHFSCLHIFFKRRKTLQVKTETESFARFSFELYRISHNKI